jgi:hypothetical protein
MARAGPSRGPFFFGCSKNAPKTKTIGPIPFLLAHFVVLLPERLRQVQVRAMFHNRATATLSPRPRDRKHQAFELSRFVSPMSPTLRQRNPQRNTPPPPRYGTNSALRRIRRQHSSPTQKKRPDQMTGPLQHRR